MYMYRYKYILVSDYIRGGRIRTDKDKSRYQSKSGLCPVRIFLAAARLIVCWEIKDRVSGYTDRDNGSALKLCLLTF